jgi:DNA-binding NarL/FixJ family response regulator
MLQPVPLRDEPVCKTLCVLCGVAHLREIVTGTLLNLGFYIDAGAPIKLVLDFPYGYGFDTLKTLTNERPRLIIVTWNPCREYHEDLWDLEPGALFAGEVFEKQNLVETLAESINHLLEDDYYRLTPGPSTSLTSRERLVLRYVALAWSNRRIAQQLSVQEQTVKNILRCVYNKLDVRCHAEAALYYWGLYSRSNQMHK